VANKEQVALLIQGAEKWNEWRKANPDKLIDLSGADLSGTKLSNVNLKKANLREANLMVADLSGADLTDADLRSVNLMAANLAGANLTNADISGADLTEADLEGAIRDTIFTLSSYASQDLAMVPDKGYILFDTPQQMQVGISEIISIRISKHKTKQFFRELRHFQANKSIETVKISRVMTAELKGDNFKIDALSSEEQIIEDDDLTQWEWNVTPVRQGTQKLIAIITIILKVEDEKGVKTLPVLEKELQVQVNRLYSTKDFISRNWQWLIASAALPIAGLILSR
jgi:hypothetical protein